MIANETLVVVTPKENDSFAEFRGTVIGYRNGNVQVRDMDDDVFEVDEEQCSTDDTEDFNRQFEEWQGDSDGTVGVD